MSTRGPGFPEPSRDPEQKGPGLGPTRLRDLLFVAVAVAAIVWVLVRFNYGSIPPVPLFAGIVLYVLAAIEAVAGFMIRARVARREISAAEGFMHPVTVARMVALAKASALVGAIAAGAWVGLAIYVFNADLAAANHDRLPSIVGLIGGIALVAAALWLEYCCRAPEDSDREDPRRAPRSDH